MDGRRAAQPRLARVRHRPRTQERIRHARLGFHVDLAVADELQRRRADRPLPSEAKLLPIQAIESKV